ncbi:MAG: hypothetical protein JWO02_4004 [Solirubrobacterales bacterium]|nr:hypothetical protein [Solirubrobacterales bacterium]
MSKREAEGELDLAVVPRAVLEQEARRNRPVGAVAIVSVIASFAALAVLVGSTSPGTTDTASKRSLEQADRDAGLLWGAVGLRVLSMVAIALVAAHLVSLIAVREQTPRMMKILAVGAPIGIIVAVIASQFALLDAASEFVGHGAQTDDRAKDLLTNGGAQRITSVATIVTALAFSVWLGWTSLAASRVGLITKFMGYFGVGGALASVLVPVAGQGLVIGWFGSIGILLLGWWPGGRGPAWTTGEVGQWNAGAADKPSRRRPA